MTDQLVKKIAAIGLGAVYVGLLGYSVLGYSGDQVPEDDESERVRTRAPRVLYHSHGVNVYERRSVRSNGQRGGGLRGGK